MPAEACSGKPKRWRSWLSAYADIVSLMMLELTRTSWRLRFACAVSSHLCNECVVSPFYLRPAPLTQRLSHHCKVEASYWDMLSRERFEGQKKRWLTPGLD